VITKLISGVINKFKLDSYRRRFFRLKSNFLDSPDATKKANIKSKIEDLLSLVEKLGEAGKPLEKDIRIFIWAKVNTSWLIQQSFGDKSTESPPNLQEPLQRSIENRERKVVITMQPNHVKGFGMRRELLEKIQKREGRTIPSKSVGLNGPKSELPPEIRYKD